MQMPKQVKIVEVGPRDGLQNETTLLSCDDKIQLIDQLSDTGLKYIEFGSFVSPKWVPQMAASDQVFKGIRKSSQITYGGLVPNLRGLESALDCGVKEIAVFTTASEKFSQKNTNCSVAESLKRIEQISRACEGTNTTLRGYVSCVAGCPYEGSVNSNDVATVSQNLIDLGCYEISLGDTIGIGTAQQISDLIAAVTQKIEANKLAIHCHNTYGQALTNIYAALQQGVCTIDAAVAGLGGCPYAKGASGNIATEDVLYLLQGLKIDTGVDLDKLIKVGNGICTKLGRQSQSKVALAKSQQQH